VVVGVASVVGVGVVMMVVVMVLVVVADDVGLSAVVDGVGVGCRCWHCGERIGAGHFE